MSSTLYTDVNADVIHFAEPQARTKGIGMSLFINANPATKQALTFQLPKSNVPFNPTEEPPNQDGSPAYKTSISIDVTDDILANILSTIDTKYLAYIMANKEKIFPGKSEEWIRQRQFPAIKHDDAGKYEPKMKIKVILNGKKPSDILVGRVVDDKILTRSGSIDDIEAGCKIVPIVTLFSGWTGTIGFGLEFRMEQCIVFKAGAKRSLGAFQGLGEVVEDTAQDDDDAGLGEYENDGDDGAKKQKCATTDDAGADQ